MDLIGNLGFSRLTVASHLDLHSALRVASIVANFTNPAWKAGFKSYDDTYGIYDDVVRRPGGSIWTPDVQAADEVRDATMHQLFTMLRGFLKSSVPAEREAAQKLLIAISPYLKDAQDKLTDQTEQVHGLIRTISENDTLFAFLKLLKLAEVLGRLDSENNAFAALYIKRSEENRHLPGYGIDTPTVRRQIDAYWRELVRMANSMVVANNAGIETPGFDPTKLKTFVDKVNAYYDQYRLVLAHQGKRHESTDEQIESTAKEIVESRHETAAKEARYEALMAQQEAEAIARAERVLAEAAQRRTEESAPLIEDDAVLAEQEAVAEALEKAEKCKKR